MKKCPSAAAAIFQRNVEQLFKGMKGVTNYLDDILITGSTFEEHKENLEKVLNRLKEAGLTVKPEKCSFFEEEPEYLRHLITREGLKKTDKKIRAIVDAPRPKTVTQVRSFCGMMQYYSKFVPHISQILKPIYNQTKQEHDGEIKWSIECEKEIRKVKQLIAQDLTLAHYDPNKELVLVTDAASERVAAILHHVKVYI